jgi:hypothetical protein
MNTLTESQIAAIKCAFVDLCASYKAWQDMDVYSHDWKAHSDSIDDLLTAFPFLKQTKKDLIFISILKRKKNLSSWLNVNADRH